MAGNGDLRHRRPISHQNLISKHVLDDFQENRKKSIFSTCHLWGQAKIMSKLTFSGRISAILYCGQVRTPQGCFQKKISQSVDLSFVRNLFLCFLEYFRKSMSFLVFCCLYVAILKVHDLSFHWKKKVISKSFLVQKLRPFEVWRWQAPITHLYLRF